MISLVLHDITNNDIMHL